MTTLRELAVEIKTWADRNFDHHDPALGVIEEIGELAHAVLKRNQKIRQSKPAEEMQTDIIDAVGDITIYLLHWCAIHAIVPHTLGKIYNIRKEREVIAHLANRAGTLVNRRSEDCEQIVGEMLGLLRGFARVFFDKELLDDIVVPTWAAVRERNWRKFPINGRTE